VHFDFDEDQRLLQSTVRDFLAAECPPERVRALWDADTGRSRELWAKLAEVGLPGVRVPEEHEGMGLDEIDVVLLCEEVGRAALAEPVVATAAVAAPLLADLPGSEVAGRWLKPIARGEAIVAVGHPASPFVGDAHVADLLLLGSDDGLHALAPADVGLVHQPANDPGERLYSVHWKASEQSLVARGEAARALLDLAFDRGALACAAQSIGVADRLVELAVEYAGQRQQFGVPIGSFQALKHMLADVKLAIEYARPLVYRAAWSVARAAASRSVHVSMAKLAAGEAAQRAARAALQVHGAIGYTWEQDLHIWMRRAWSLDQAWGIPRAHRQRLAHFALADGAPLGAGRTFR
jgi:alkylation response protein AidB-like acyl-CoA dehydrogenase